MKNKINYFFIFLFLIFILLIIALISLSVGSTYLGINDVIDVLTKNAVEKTFNIIINIRLPRVLGAIFLGGALSVSGMLLQTFFNNPIAGPYVLGISQGAKMCVAVFMICTLKYGIIINSVGMIISAFFGSLISTVFVLLISSKTRNMSMLIVCGILIGYICSAITDLIITFADDSDIVNLHNWSMGSFSGINWSNIYVIMLVVTTSFFAVFLLSKPLGAYLHGADYAMSLGVNVLFLRIMIIVLSGILSATVTAFAGPISFVGIAVPHLVKSITRCARPIIHIPACFILGAIVTLLCDDIARVIFAPTELAISTVTAIVLVPVVIIVMLRRVRDE